MFVFNDGGRAAAGYKGTAGDCVTRAVAIATGESYADVYTALASGMGTQRVTKHHRKRKRSARNGVSVRRKWFRDYLTVRGWKWTPTMHIGSGCKVHLKASELPAGKIIVAVSRHYVAMIDGVIHDTYDCSRDGERCVYGYWSQAT